MTVAESIRARQLLRMGRHAEAAEALKRCIGADPDTADHYALLAICLAHLDRHQEAARAAEDAIARAPDDPFCFQAKAYAKLGDRRFREAETAAREALALDPEDADSYGVIAGCRSARDDAAGGLEAAERGLAIDPEHDRCLDLRAHCLTRLGRHEEAALAIQGALQRAPDDTDAHANQGWAGLHAGRHAEAVTHFEEDLRLDPENGYARHGLVEALKARHGLYRLFLGWVLWLSELPALARWGVIIGGFVLHRLAMQIGDAYPGLALWLAPLVWGYFAFAVLTWLADPLFNALLWLHPRGRHALTPRQRQGAAAACALLALSLAGVIAYAASSAAIWLLVALMASMLGAHANSALSADNVRHRRILTVAVAVLLVMAASGLVLIAREQVFGVDLYRYTFWGWIGYLFLHAHLVTRGA